MTSIILASIRQHSRRFIATGIAIIIAVAFVVTGLVVTDSFSESVKNSFTAEFMHADLRISATDDEGFGDNVDADGVPIDPTLQPLQEAVSIAQENPSVDSADLRIDSSIKLTSGESTSNLSYSVLVDEPLRWYTLGEGTWPTQPTDIVLDQSTAKQLNVGIGHTVTGDVSYADTSNPIELTVVGITKDTAGTSSFNGSNVLGSVSVIDHIKGVKQAKFGLIKVKQGTQLTPLRTQLDQRFAPLKVKTETKEEVATESVEDLSGSSMVLQAFILTFGLLALVVAGFVIANTFQLIVAQRTKELALLRCVGTTRGQIRRMILGEAICVGLGFSLLGALAGIGTAYGLRALATAGDGVFDFGVIALNPLTILGSILLGTLTTVIFAYGPARNAFSVHPIAALRPLPAEVRAKRHLVSGIIGACLALIGTLGMVLLAFSGELLGAIACGFFSAIGVLLLTRMILPRLIYGVGKVIAPINATTELAAANTIRNPGRTAATGTALLIGTVLIAMLTTGIYSTRESVLNTIDEKRPIDLVAMSAVPEEVGGATIEQLAQVKHVEAVAPVVSTEVTVTKADGTALQAEAYGFDQHTFDQAVHSPVATPQQGTVLVHTKNEFGLQQGQTITVSGPTGKTTATVVVDDARAPGTIDMTKDDLAAIDRGAKVSIVFIKLTPELPANQVEKAIDDLSKVGDSIDVTGPAPERAFYTEILRTILIVVLALLGVSVVIAIVGLGNTTALSVLERRQESAMLRSVGLTRGELRAMITIEAVLAAVVTVVLGVLLGVGYAWAGVIALGNAASQIGMQLHIPWGQMGLLVAGAFVAGLLAAAVPAFGAAKRPIVADLAAT